MRRKKSKAEQVWDRVFPFIVGDILVFDPDTAKHRRFKSLDWKWRVVRVTNEMIYLEQANDKGMTWNLFNRPDHPLTRKFVRVGHEDAV